MVYVEVGVMSGYRDMLRIQRIEKEANLLGFRLGNPKNGDYHREWGDLVSAYHKDDCFPMYSRDAELFTGTLEDFEHWLHGVQWAREYDEMMKVSNQEKRERKEQDMRNKHLVATLKNEELELRNK